MRWNCFTTRKRRRGRTFPNKQRPCQVSKLAKKKKIFDSILLQFRGIVLDEAFGHQQCWKIICQCIIEATRKDGWRKNYSRIGWIIHLFLSWKKYSNDQNIGFKALLILDNAPSHRTTLTCPIVEILFLKPNTTSLIQPLDQETIRKRNHHYDHRSYRYILKIVEDNVSLTYAW